MEKVSSVLSHYRRESRCTYARLVERAVTAVESGSDAVAGSGSGAVAGDWGRRLDALRKWVGALRRFPTAEGMWHGEGREERRGPNAVGPVGDR